jgi:ketosteroid isomerase-like protein
MEIPDYLSGVDPRTLPESPSDTFMSSATTELSVLDPAPISRRLAIGRMIATALVLAACCSILYAGQAKPKKHDNSHEIEKLEEAWRNAVLNSDTTAMSALLSDDYIAITASGTLQTKDEALANLGSGRHHVTALDISDRKVRFYGKTALVTSLANVQSTTAQGDVNGSFRYTRVYVRDPQDKWKIVSFEASRIRQPGERTKLDSVTNTK